MTIEHPTPPSSAKVRSNRVDALLALRGVACVMVVVAHCNAPREAIFWGDFDLSWLLFSAGGVAVRVFFCLSGYLMGKVFYTGRYTTDFKGILRFWRNRALRIFPLYYFAILLLSLLVYPDILRPQNWIYLFRLCSFTYHQMLPVGFNGALWSLSTEVQFYFLVPVLFLYFQSRLINWQRVLGAYVGIIVLGFALRYGVWLAIDAQFPPPENAIAFVKYVYVPMVMNLDVFLGGFLLNFWIAGKSERRWTVKPRDRLLSLILLVFIYLFTAFYKYYNQEILGLFSPTLTLLITGFFILVFESGDRYFKFHKNNKKLSFYSSLQNPLRFLEYVGVLSYGIYVWHLPILAKIQPIFTSNIALKAYAYRLVATLILSTVLATVTYKLVEKNAAMQKK